MSPSQLDLARSQKKVGCDLLQWPCPEEQQRGAGAHLPRIPSMIWEELQVSSSGDSPAFVLSKWSRAERGERREGFSVCERMWVCSETQ